PDRGADRPAVRGVLHAGRGGLSAAPAGVERAGAGSAGRRTRRAGHRCLAGGAVAGGKRMAADLGAWLCFEDEAGQGLRPPKGRTWGRRGATPVVAVSAAGSARVSLAGLVCTKPGQRSRLIYRTRTHRGRKGEPKGFAE